MYESPDSDFRLRDLAILPSLRGPAAISSNEVVIRATDLMARLAKSGPPSVRTTPPKVEASLDDGVNFYLVSWPTTNLHFREGLGSIEIDARSGRVASVRLCAPEFYDPIAAGQIADCVYTPDPPKPPPKPAIVWPKPSVEQINWLIPKWLNFCRGLGLDPGSQTNAAGVDWERTMLFTNQPTRVGWGDDFVVYYKSGASFEAVNGKTISHCDPVAAFSGAWADRPAGHWAHFQGAPARKWEDLAQDLNSMLIQRLAISKGVLDKYTPQLYSGGASGVSRCLVRWYDKAQWSNPNTDFNTIKTGLFVEFDLQTGAIHIIRFDDPELLQWQKD